MVPTPIRGQITMQHKHYTVQEATKKMEHFCAYQERCHKEVVAKLKTMGMIPLAVDQIMGHLIQGNYLNEERFAQSYARGKHRIKKWGRKRIERELRQRDISAYNVRRALQEIPEDTYLQTLEALALKKWEQLGKGNVQARKRKLSQYLLYRGWEPHLVYDLAHRLGAKG
ncbi:regulatory protein RecX [Maribacter sp. 2307ULW6-5]|uniref:regulatory protein RecX n=1 Tax=Maribacter sp. 2307ULW6-5 TaxID=3386275 RepID=UPI0039BD4587